MKLLSSIKFAKFLTFVFFLLLVSCNKTNQVNPRLAKEMPPKFLWAWERSEDLRFLDSKQYGVAFYAQRLYLQNDEVVFNPRRQPLEVNPDIYLIAVTRIETNKQGGKRPVFSERQLNNLVNLVTQTLNRPNVRAVQIDFDAVASERKFYRQFITQLKKSIPENMPLTMTSLASWCVGDAWFNDFPVDEAVPMSFDMGADDETIKTFLRNGNDWNEPLCRGSYGFSLEDAFDFDRKPNRRVYYFKSSAWTKADLEKLK